MNAVFDALWRAAVQCLHPRVILWSLLPLLLAGGAVAVLGWAYWESTVAGVRGALEQWSLVAAMLHWLDSVGAGSLRSLLAPLIVVALSVPAVVVLTLLLVALLVTPTVVRMVAERRFPALERKEGGTWWGGALWSLACTVARWQAPQAWRATRMSPGLMKRMKAGDSRLSCVKLPGGLADDG